MKDWIFKTDEYICDLRTVGVLVRDGKLLVQRMKNAIASIQKQYIETERE